MSTIQLVEPSQGKDALRIGDSNGLVVVDKYEGFPKGDFAVAKHAHVLICTNGQAQFEYDGKTIQLRKNDLFLYIMLNSVISNFTCSPDFNCHEIWFTREEAWNMSMYGNVNLSNMVSMKQHPKITLSDDEADLLESYFQVLCQQMRDQDAFLYNDIVRSLIGTFLLRILSYYRTKNEQEEDAQENPVLSGKQLADRFVAMVEKSEGRIRRVDDFARRLNVSPKYLSTVLQDTINHRPSEIIAIFTMKAIEQRLRFTNQTMQAIAYDMNFPNASFFGKYVKAHLGMTPMDFRRKYANTNS